MTLELVAEEVVVPLRASKRNQDGTWNVYGVPVVCEIGYTLKSGAEFTFTRKWQEKAVEASRAEAGAGYLAPLKIRHAGDDEPPEFAGHYVLKSVEEMEVPRLGKVWGTYADYLSVPHHVYCRMARGELPYVSLEAADVDVARIDALALLDRDAPHIPFPLLRVPDPDTPADAFTNLLVDNGGESGPMTLFRHGKRAALLSRFPMPDDGAKPGDAKPGEKPKDGGGGGDGKGGEESVEKIVDLVLTSPQHREFVRGLVKELLMSTTPNATPDASGGASPSKPKDGPHDVKAQQEETERALAAANDATAKVASLQAKVDVLEGKDKARETEAALVKEVDATLSRLSTAGYVLGDKARETLLSDAKTFGAAYCKKYEENVRALGTPAPGVIDAALLAASGSGETRKDLPPIVLSYGSNRSQLERAVNANRRFDELRSLGRMREEQRETFVRIEVEGVAAALAAPVKS